MNKQQESGQIVVFAALMMVVFLGIAGFALNASYAFYQHSRMQDDVDNAVKYAAVGGDAKALLAARGYDTTGITINPTPKTGPYAGKSGYVEGFMTQNPGSLFGNILSFPFRISVHAVAASGGSIKTVVLPSGLALDDVPGDCGVQVQGGKGSETFNVQYDLYSDSDICQSTNGYLSVSGSKVKNAKYSNPFSMSLSYNATSWPDAITICTKTTKMPCDYPNFSAYFAGEGLNNNGCASKIDYEFKGGTATASKGTVYYFPKDNTGQATVPPDNNNTFGVSGKGYQFYDYCGGSAPGQYYFTGNVSLNGGSFTTHNSTVILGPDVGFTQNGSTTVNLDDPSSGRFMTDYSIGIALWEDMSMPCSSHPQVDLHGNSTDTIRGIVDVQCAVVEATGDSGNSTDSALSGALIAWQIVVSGNGNFNILPPNGPVTGHSPRGAVVVQ
jgi:Putative Flp pilus-assembly TadE/G-like